MRAHLKTIFFLLFFIGINVSMGFSQQTPVVPDTLKGSTTVLNDAIEPNLINAVDSVTPKSLMPLDSLRKAFIMESLSKGFGFESIDFNALIDSYLLNSVSKSAVQQGDKLPKGDIWVLVVLVVLIVVFAILKSIFSKQLFTIMQSFFSNRVLVNLNKEDNLFTSWPFLLLFIQFGFTLGLFIYLAADYQKLAYTGTGFQFYLTSSILIIVLYVFKILILRLMGYIFNIQKPINEYVSILYLSYFNTAILFIPLVIAFALSPIRNGNNYIMIAIVLVTIIFVFQFIRAGINILSHHRFSKVYIFLYFCTLEICPILILIKAVGF